jgi:hypothetical protein
VSELAPLDFAFMDDREASYYLALGHEPVAEPHALHVLPYCGYPDPPPDPFVEEAVGRCPFHGGVPMYFGWQGPGCEQCERQAHEARGCVCAMSARCRACRA